MVRPKEKYDLFPIRSLKNLGWVCRQTFFYKNFFEKKKSKNRLQYPKRLQKSLSRPQNIRVGRVTGNETFSFFDLRVNMQ